MERKQCSPQPKNSSNPDRIQPQVPLQSNQNVLSKASVKRSLPMDPRRGIPNKQPKIIMETESSSKILNQSNDSFKYVRKETLTNNNNLSRTHEQVVEKRIIENDNNGRVSVKNNVENTVTVLQTSPNQTHHITECSHIRDMPIISEDSLLQDPVDRKTVIETNRYDINTNLQSEPEKKIVNQVLRDQQSQTDQIIKGSPSNGNQMSQNGRQELPEKTTEMNLVGQRDPSHKVTETTLFALKKYTSKANNSQQLSKSQGIENNRNISNQNSRENNKAIITPSPGSKYINHVAVPQNIKNNAPPAARNISNSDNQVNGACENLHENPLPPAYNIVVHSGSDANEVIIRRSEEMESDDQRKSQNFTKNLSLAEKNYITIANCLSKMHNPPAPTRRMSYGPRAQNEFVRKTTTANANHEKSTTLDMKHLPSKHNQVSQLPHHKPLNQNHSSIDLQNDKPKLPDSQILFAGRSAASNYVHQRTGLQETKQNKQSAVHNIPTQPYQISQHPYQEQLRPELKGYTLQAPHSGFTNFKPYSKTNSRDIRSNAYNNTYNSLPGVQNIPLANQWSQSAQHLYQKQIVPDNGIHMTAPQLPARGHPIEVNGANLRAYLQSIPFAVQNCSNSASNPHYSNQYSLGRQILPVTEATNSANVVNQPRLISHEKWPPSSIDFSNQRPCPQDISVDQTVEQNSNRRNRCSQHNTENGSPAKPNSTTSANQFMKPSIGERHSPIIGDFVHQKTCTEKIPVEKCMQSGSPSAANRLVSDRLRAKQQQEQEVLNSLKLFYSKLHAKLDKMDEARNNELKKWRNGEKDKKIMDNIISQYREMRIRNEFVSILKSVLENEKKDIKTLVDFFCDDDHDNDSDDITSTSKDTTLESNKSTVKIGNREI